VDAENHRQTVTAFLSAAAGGNLQGLLSLLDPDVVATSDGGGQVSAARRPVAGADKVSRFIMGLFTVAPGREARLVMVNGTLGFACFRRGVLDFVASVTTVAGQIATIDIVRAPGKLERALTGDREQ
jgi:RNA polymerase sigma-70 factor (ECF subfamily)